MIYVKPEILAQNSAQGSFAAGCPQDQRQCSCENTK